MNRQEALAWLVDNVVKWPDDEYKKRPHGWQWAYSKGEYYLLSYGNRYGVITKSDWLAAIENKSRGEA